MIKRSSGLWLLCSPALWAAQIGDPFQPPSIISCTAQHAPPMHWRLKGTLGHDALRYGWVVTPEDQWLRLSAQQMLPGGHWQVSRISARSVEFLASASNVLCPTSISTYTLTLGDHKETQ